MSDFGFGCRLDYLHAMLLPHVFIKAANFSAEFFLPCRILCLEHFRSGDVILEQNYNLHVRSENALPTDKLTRFLMHHKLLRAIVHNAVDRKFRRMPLAERRQGFPKKCEHLFHELYTTVTSCAYIRFRLQDCTTRAQQMTCSARIPRINLVPLSSYRCYMLQIQ